MFDQHFAKILFSEHILNHDLKFCPSGVFVLQMRLVRFAASRCTERP